MVQVRIVYPDGFVKTIEFASRGLAAQAVRQALKMRLKARIITPENLPALRMGGYGGVDRLRPVHCL